MGACCLITGARNSSSSSSSSGGGGGRSSTFVRAGRSEPLWSSWKLFVRDFFDAGESIPATFSRASEAVRFDIVCMLERWDGGMGACVVLFLEATFFQVTAKTSKANARLNVNLWKFDIYFFQLPPPRHHLEII